MKVKDKKLDTAKFAGIIAEAFPYIRRLSGEVIVVKCGGRVMEDDKLRRDLARDLSLLRQIGISIVMVHGGGPQISAMVERLGLENRFHEGLRVTDDSTMDIVEMVLSGAVNSTMVGLINHFGGNAVGISGRDASFIRAQKLSQLSLLDKNSSNEKLPVDLGRVGEIVQVNVDLIHYLTEMGYMPVVAPIGVDDESRSYNINADVVASRLAVALQCSKFIILTDTPGVLDADGNLLTDLNLSNLKELKRKGVIHGGMLPKINAATAAIEEGVVAVQVIDGRRQHSLLLELFSDEGIGSLIKA
ncbi:MAG: acetylglutamate kinase [Gammaproteobacteria bacterium]|nr:acetylglutamate kinase [Gammaproteobacteria bacterium]